MPKKPQRRNPQATDAGDRDAYFEALQAYDELRAEVAEIEALLHAATEVVLPHVPDREQRRSMSRLGCYVYAAAERARNAVDDAEKTAAALMKARKARSDDR